MRVTTLSTANTMVNYISTGESKYYDLSEEAASGLKVRKPSDDATATKSLLNIKTQLNQMNSYLNNMKTSQNELNVLDDTLSSVATAIGSATNLATQSANGTYSNSDMDKIKIQIDQVVQNVLDLANTQYDGTYIFSGNATSTPAYSVTKDGSGNITAITYQGTPATGNYQRYTTISDGVSVAVNTAGSSVFGSYDSTATPATATGLFGTLMTLSNALGSHNQTAVSNTLTGLDTALDTVSTTRTKFASVSSKFDMTTNSINSSITTLTSYRSQLQDADLSEVLVDLTAQETALKATMSVTTNLLSKASILDYM